VNYYDGQGFLVKQSLGVKSAKELDGAAVCIQSGTTTELNLADYFRANGGMKYTPVVFDTSDQTVKGFEAGRCDVLTSDQSQLYALKIKLTKPEEAVVLPEVISKEPLGPAVRQGDDQWFKVVRWSLNAMLNAEEAGSPVPTWTRCSSPPTLTSVACWGWKSPKGLCWGWMTNGPTTSSNRSATTVNPSIATSVPAPPQD
jgi:ABC-type amino acid transport substrate-binding protein